MPLSPGNSESHMYSSKGAALSRLMVLDGFLNHHMYHTFSQHRSELPKLLSFLRAACLDPLLQESWASREKVLAPASIDRRRRAVTLRDEYIERVSSSTESPHLHLRLKGSYRQQNGGSTGFEGGAGLGGRRGMKGRERTQRVLMYEERDVRSSAEVLIRHRITTPVYGEDVAGEEPEEDGWAGRGARAKKERATTTVARAEVARNQEEGAFETFLRFQGCSVQSRELLKRGIRCQLTEGVRISVFRIERGQQGLSGTGGGGEGDDAAMDLLFVELEAPVGAHGSVLASIEAVKEAAAVLRG